MGQAIEDENTHPIFLRNRHRGHKYALWQRFCPLDDPEKSSRALNRPESTFFRTENRAVMGFSKKDLGDSSGAPKPAEIPYF